jgi:hypothetical protein
MSLSASAFISRGTQLMRTLLKRAASLLEIVVELAEMCVFHGGATIHLVYVSRIEALQDSATRTPETAYGCPYLQ